MRRVRAVAVSIISASAGWGCLADARTTCGNQVLQEVRSPGKDVKAVVFTRDCGATTGFSTHVSVMPLDASLEADDGGNLFIGDGDRGAAPPGTGGGPEVRVEWLGGSRLRVLRDSRARVFKAESVVADVRVEYLDLPAEGRTP